MQDQILSEHFSLSEFTRSSVAERNHINNTIDLISPKGEMVLANLRNLCKEVLEPLRAQTGTPVIISSGYRCPELNRFVGGVSNSQHMTGQAADIILPSALGKDPSTLREWYRILADGVFDQLIMESKGSQRWIHVSCRLDLTQNRQHAFHMNK